MSSKTACITVGKPPKSKQAASDRDSEDDAAGSTFEPSLLFDVERASRTPRPLTSTLGDHHHDMTNTGESDTENETRASSNRSSRPGSRPGSIVGSPPAFMRALTGSLTQTLKDCMGDSRARREEDGKRQIEETSNLASAKQNQQFQHQADVQHQFMQFMLEMVADGQETPKESSLSSSSTFAPSSGPASSSHTMTTTDFHPHPMMVPGGELDMQTRFGIGGTSISFPTQTNLNADSPPEDCDEH